MEVFTMVVLIVFVACGAGVANNYIKMQSKRDKAGKADDTTLAELADLRARIEVLEKIVTDEKYQLKRDLRSLENS